MINLKDVLVVGLALAGGLSDFNNFDIPYWVYIVLLVVYAFLRLFDKSIDVLSVKQDDSIGGGGIKNPQRRSYKKEDSIGGGGIKNPQ